MSDNLADLELFNAINDLGDMSPDKIKRFYQMKDIIKFAQLKSENRGVKQAELAKKMGTSKSSLQRTRKDLNLSSFYRHDVPVKTKKPVKLTTDEISVLKSSNLTTEEQERLTQYVSKETQKELEKQARAENHKTTMRDLKTKAVELISEGRSRPITTAKQMKSRRGKTVVNPVAGDGIESDYIDKVLRSAPKDDFDTEKFLAEKNSTY
jgi:predicted DNA-binding protein (UPF0251 family)